MRFEHSAGFIVIRRGTPSRVLLLLYPGGYWDFPKGHLEQGEKALDAAIRELAEETGIADIRPLPGFSRDMHYTFRRPRGAVRKTVTYFIGETDAQDVRISDEHIGFAWVPFQAAVKMATYKNAKDLLHAAHRFFHETRHHR